MSVTGVFQGGLERPTPTRLTTADLTACYTAADNFSTVCAWSLANETGGAVRADCYYYNGTTNFLVFSRSIPANDTVIVEAIPLRLRKDDVFKVQAASANAITVTPAVTRTHPNEVR